MSRQTAALIMAAEQLVAEATVYGKACALPAGVEASSTLQLAYARSIAQMIGPGADPSRLRAAQQMAAEHLLKDIFVMYFDLFGQPVEGGSGI